MASIPFNPPIYNVSQLIFFFTKQGENIRLFLALKRVQPVINNALPLAKDRSSIRSGCRGGCTGKIMACRLYQLADITPSPHFASRGTGPARR